MTDLKVQREKVANFENSEGQSDQCEHSEEKVAKCQVDDDCCSCSSSTRPRESPELVRQG